MSRSTSDLKVSKKYHLFLNKTKTLFDKILISNGFGNYIREKSLDDYIIIAKKVLNKYPDVADLSYEDAKILLHREIRLDYPDINLNMIEKMFTDDEKVEMYDLFVQFEKIVSLLE